jgi:hypothetical protein
MWYKRRLQSHTVKILTLHRHKDSSGISCSDNNSITSLKTWTAVHSDEQPFFFLKFLP